jgi:anhydro-N-acetylmuramic acid kinase
MSSMTSIGLMSGTSMDGIDAVIIKTDGKYKIKQLCNLSINYSPEFTLLLKTAEYAVRRCKGDMKLARQNYMILANEYLQNKILLEKLFLSQMIDFEGGLASIINHSTILHAEIVNDLLKKVKMKAKDIDIIGYHGQALYHMPSDNITIQVGDGQLLADITSIPVINNFRIDDVMNGGQGAPLAPIYHQALAIRDGIYPLAVLNCGGIANITIIAGKHEDDIIGFDTGPGNLLIDQYVRNYTDNKEFMDKDGQYGSKGIVDDNLLELLYEKSVTGNKKNYFAKIPPKSLDPGDFVLVDELKNFNIEDVCATLEAFTAYTIVDSLKLVNHDIPKKFVLAGGGWNNPVIVKMLKIYLNKILNTDTEVVSADQIGWDSTYMEAEIFAYLAVRSLKGLPLTFSQTTNVRKAISGGYYHAPNGVISQKL